MIIFYKLMCIYIYILYIKYLFFLSGHSNIQNIDYKLEFDFKILKRKYLNIWIFIFVI